MLADARTAHGTLAIAPLDASEARLAERHVPARAKGVLARPVVADAAGEILFVLHLHGFEAMPERLRHGVRPRR